MFTQIIGMMTEAVTFVYDTFNAFVNGSFFSLFITMFVLCDFLLSRLLVMA